jgi:2-polyprenyl-3-methyl-5-hydroxy-6-metoxy-1,4-benzoquinol methylase
MKDYLKFNKFYFSRTAFSCPVCMKSNSRVRVTLRYDSKRLKMYQCNCGTLYFPNAKAPNYLEIEGLDSFYMRIDQFEGIDSALMPLFSSPSLSDLSVIDVGCGLGFTSDFVRFKGRECLAFDPSTAARLSSLMLGIEISQEYASPMNTVVTGNKLVFCSEVIEHVENPSNFISNLRSISGDNGFLILTTPNSEFVKASNSSASLFSILAPSQHLFLLSDSSLSKLAMEAGYSWVHTWTSNERLFLIAGPKPVLVSNEFSRRDYVNYLETRLNSSVVKLDLRYRTFGYRLFKEYVHSGEYFLAQDLWLRLSEVYSEIGINIEDPHSIYQIYSEVSHQGLTLPPPKYYPFNVPMLLYLRAVLYIVLNHDRVAAEPYLVSADAIADLYLNVANAKVFQTYDLELQSIKSWVYDIKREHPL